jgi:hypothetical protein
LRVGGAQLGGLPAVFVGRAGGPRREAGREIGRRLLRPFALLAFGLRRLGPAQGCVVRLLVGIEQGGDALVGPLHPHLVVEAGPQQAVGRQVGVSAGALGGPALLELCAQLIQGGALLGTQVELVRVIPNLAGRGGVGSQGGGTGEQQGESFHRVSTRPSRCR